MLAVLKKELRIYFTSLLGYIVIGIYLIVASAAFYGMYVKNSGYSDFSYFFGFTNTIFMFLSPLITFRIIAEDKHYGSFELLMTSPTSPWGIVMGKFLAVWIFAMVGNTFLLFYPTFLSFVADVDWGSVISSYFGMFFSVAFFISVGIAASSMTKNYVIAAIIAFGTVILLYIIENFSGSSSLLEKFFQEISYGYHYRQFSMGIVLLKDILYFVFGSFLFLYLAKDRVEASSLK